LTEATTPTNTCGTCGITGGPNEFYEGSSECRGCKRERSRRNRQTTALKVALADRVIDFVRQLADEGALRELAFTTNGRGPDSDCNAAGPLE
jgi:hypothetical protein